MSEAFKNLLEAAEAIIPAAEAADRVCESEGIGPDDLPNLIEQLKRAVEAARLEGGA
jgi:hypothetical protein